MFSPDSLRQYRVVSNEGALFWCADIYGDINLQKATKIDEDALKPRITDERPVSEDTISFFALSLRKLRMSYVSSKGVATFLGLSALITNLGYSVAFLRKRV